MLCVASRLENGTSLFPTLDKNVDFVHVGNLYDRAKFSTHFIHLHGIPPYSLPDMCRKCQVLVSRTCRKS